MTFPKENIIDNWLNQKGDPEVAKLVERNLSIANRVLTILKERGINKSKFAEMLEKKPSEITKWLSGAHNLTMKSIVKMEIALGINLLAVVGANNNNNPSEKEYVYLGSIQGSIEEAINDYHKTTINDKPDSDFDIAM
ncbi:helix-turn-helix transcriptional regulator [Flavivirga aquimarina]|uniref:Helix-turn-helix transcriptional regulator n=1 Tax=Flavivirga aquimarina TaxID=2027862 RepID=A0ABT8W6C6_9FLAO|nr:helix-turn-helix transcriptional regulator [Flavivirga aquimarina]MDO5968669.1 helix-turn-helix transcriptional regulator [Flavivirga aquimarina]